MGPADTRLCAFPSPASTTSNALETPTINSTLARATTGSALWSPRSLLPDTANILPTEPTAIFGGVQPLLTPPLDPNMQPDMDLLVGGALAPVHTTAPARPQAKAGAGVGLRLPSFEALGIAAPHHRYGQQSFDGTASDSGRGLLRDPLGLPCVEFQGFDVRRGTEVPTVGGAPSIDPLRSGRAMQSPPHPFLSILTPPVDVAEQTWPEPMEVATGDAGVAATVAMDAQAEVEGGVSAGSGQNMHAPPDSVERMSQWIDGALDVLRMSAISWSGATHADSHS